MNTQERVEFKRKAHNWDMTVKWVLVPAIFLAVMILCGWLDAPPTR